MYFFSVAAMFKNEQYCIVEWIEHYLNQGADHFYLINDDSNDKTYELLAPYLSRGLITLYQTYQPTPHSLGFQMTMYTKCFLPHLNNKDTKWLLICDIDEFVWSPKFKSLKEFLSDYVYPLAQVQIRPTIFGSNYLEKQPRSLVQGFTRRTKELPTKCGTYKYFVNSDFKFKSLNVHHAISENPEHMKKDYFLLVSSDYIRLNHYICQSKEFWLNVKCRRGDADGYLEKTIELFNEYNSYANEVEDYELAIINKNLLY